MDKITTTKRTINYFEITPLLIANKSISDFTDIFSGIISLSNSKSKDRFVLNNLKQLYLTGIKVDNKLNQISGKLLNIRMENFPELMNTKDDAIRDIEATEEEGIIESSHFIMSFSKAPIILSFEFNQYGPRISDFIYYLEHFLLKSKVVTKVSYKPFVRDDLPKYKRRINRVSAVIAKVHKDNIKRINEFDKELFDAFETASNISESEYVTLKLKYDYRKLEDTPIIRTKILKLITKLIENKTLHSVFGKFNVIAEDGDISNKLKDFDLLNIWIKTTITVEKKPKSRVIITEDILTKMTSEINREFSR